MSVVSQARGRKAAGEESNSLFPTLFVLPKSVLRRKLQFKCARLSLNMKTESDFYSRICLLRDTGDMSMFKVYRFQSHPLSK